MSGMKKILLVLVAVLLGGICADSAQVQAYSVTLQKDGMYAELLPDSVVENSTVFFKKSVEKAMKYYNKYKDAGAYTLATEVPAQYLDFMSVAKKIRDSDEIVIRNPFYIYEAGDSGGGIYNYYFVAERNGKRLCLFSVQVDAEEESNEKVRFWYDKAMNRYFLYDDETIEDTLFYKLGDITYAETPKKTSVVRDQTQTLKNMVTVGEDHTEEQEKRFKNKNYEQKKDEIFSFLRKIKKEPNTKKAEKNIKLQLKEDYIEPERDAQENTGRGWGYPLAGVAVLAAGGLIAVIFFRKKRRPE